MTDTRISAADLLRLATIASVSPEGTAEEVVAILQRTGPGDTDIASAFPHLASEASGEAAGGDADDDKLAKPE